MFGKELRATQKSLSDLREKYAALAKAVKEYQLEVECPIKDHTMIRQRQEALFNQFKKENQ